MLALSLRPGGETVRIGDDIYLRVAWVDGKKVRIGIEAPRHIPIVRLPDGAAVPFSLSDVGRKEDCDDPTSP